MKAYVRCAGECGRILLVDSDQASNTAVYCIRCVGENYPKKHRIKKGEKRANK